MKERREDVELNVVRESFSLALFECRKEPEAVVDVAASITLFLVTPRLLFFLRNLSLINPFA